MSSRQPKCHGNRTAATVTAGSFSYWWGQLPGRPAPLLPRPLAPLSSPMSPWNFNDLLSLLLIFLLSVHLVCVFVHACVSWMSSSLSKLTRTKCPQLIQEENKGDVILMAYGCKGHVFLWLWKTSSGLLLLATSGLHLRLFGWWTALFLCQHANRKAGNKMGEEYWLVNGLIQQRWSWSCLFVVPTRKWH